MSKVNVSDLLEAGLRAEQLRQKAIASNTANLETAGYRAVDLKFEELLSRALQDGDSDAANTTGELIISGSTMLKSNGNDVSLEVEVGKMIENSLRHETFVRLLGKKYKQMDIAMQVS